MPSKGISSVYQTFKKRQTYSKVFPTLLQKEQGKYITELFLNSLICLSDDGHTHRNSWRENASKKTAEQKSFRQLISGLATEHRIQQRNDTQICSSKYHRIQWPFRSDHPCQIPSLHLVEISKIHLTECATFRSLTISFHLFQISLWPGISFALCSGRIKSKGTIRSSRETNSF